MWLTTSERSVFECIKNNLKSLKTRVLLGNLHAVLCPSTPNLLRFAYQVTSKYLSLLNLFACHHSVKFSFVLFCKCGFLGITNSPIIKGGMHMISNFLGECNRDSSRIVKPTMFSRTHWMSASLNKIGAFFITLKLAKSVAQFEVLKSDQRWCTQKTYKRMHEQCKCTKIEPKQHDTYIRPQISWFFIGASKGAIVHFSVVKAKFCDKILHEWHLFHQGRWIFNHYNQMWIQTLSPSHDVHHLHKEPIMFVRFRSLFVLALGWRAMCSSFRWHSIQEILC